MTEFTKMKISFAPGAYWEPSSLCTHSSTGLPTRGSSTWVTI